MKRNIILYSIFIITISLFSCKKPQDKYQTVTDRIVFDTKIMNSDPDADPWKDNIEGPQREKFVNLILDAVKNNKVKIYDKAHKEVKYEDVISHLISYDTIKSSDKKNKKGTDEVIISNSFDKNKITQLKFDEKWTVNERTFEIKKEVFGFCPVMAEYDQEGTSKYQQPLFWIYADTLNTDTANSTYIITKKIQYAVPIKANEKSTDWWVNNIEPTQRDTFVTTIINAVFDNKLKAYDYLDNPVTKDSFNKMFNRTDTITVEDIETGSLKEKIIKHEFDKESIDKMRFIEEWSLNTKTFKFTKRVLAISPLSKVMDSEGNIKGWLPLFVVYFDNSLIPSQKQ